MATIKEKIFIEFKVDSKQMLNALKRTVKAQKEFQKAIKTLRKSKITIEYINQKRRKWYQFWK